MPQNTPWTIERSGTGSGIAIAVRDAAGRDINARAIGFSTSSEANENTDLIVRAVNAYDSMLEALRTAREQLVLLGGDPSQSPHGDQIQQAVLDMVDAALSKAEAR